MITSQRHYRDWTWEMDGLTRNIAPHPISMGARTVLQALKHYHQDAVQPEHFMELMSRYNDLVYPGVHPSDRCGGERARVLLEVGAVLAVDAAEGIGHLARLPFDVPVARGRGRRRLTPRGELASSCSEARRWPYFLSMGCAITATI